MFRVQCPTSKNNTKQPWSIEKHYIVKDSSSSLLDVVQIILLTYNDYTYLRLKKMRNTAVRSSNIWRMVHGRPAQLSSGWVQPAFTVELLACGRLGQSSWVVKPQLPLTKREPKGQLRVSLWDRCLDSRAGNLGAPTIAISLCSFAVSSNTLLQCSAYVHLSCTQAGPSRMGFISMFQRMGPGVRLPDLRDPTIQ